MPIPLIPVIAIAASSLAAATGLYKGGKGIHKNIKAEKINKEAAELIECAQSKAEQAANRSEERLNALGKVKLNVLDRSMHRFISTFDQIHSIELTHSVGIDELGKYRIDKQVTPELRKMTELAAETLSGVIGGAGAGALTAFGAYSATMTFASASTGTAIATLSGIAAQNATLAFLGGGAIAAGGGGMALGTLVLGGLVAGPALAVSGIVVDASALKNLEKALSNMAEAQVVVEDLKVVEVQCEGIAKRANMFNRLLCRLDAVFVELISRLEDIVAARGTDYSRYSRAEQNVVAMAMSAAGAVKKILDTPILSSDGGLTEESEKTHAEVTQYLGELKKAAAEV